MGMAAVKTEPGNVRQIRPEVKCASCGHTIFDGLVIKARVVRLLAGGGEALCKRCKSWVAVPVTYVG